MRFSHGIRGVNTIQGDIAFGEAYTLFYLATSVMAQISSSSSTKEGNTSTESGSGAFYYHKDSLYLHQSDNSGAHLVPTLLTTSNYVVWSRFMKRALQSKNKLGFVDGSFPQPSDENFEKFLQWSFVDSIVAAWITNGMTKDLAEEYAFSTSARQLWLDLEEKYGTGDKPQAFNLKKKLAAMRQNGDSLAVYSNRLLKCWEELNCLEPKIRCPSTDSKCCNTNKKHDDCHSSNLVLQFLMGLDECYDAVVSNILMLEPTPPYNKAYAMVARIESQRGMAASSTNVTESSALAVKVAEQQKLSSGGKNSSMATRKDVKKGDRYCNHCNRSGHMDDTCFRKHGYPEWYKEYKTQKGKKGQSMSNNVSEGDSSQSGKGFDMDAFSEMIQKELQKFMKSKGANEEKSVNTTCFADFAGNIRNSYASKCFKSGEVKINSKLTLQGVLYIPDFRYNLISVHRLAEGGKIQFSFNGCECVMQDLLSKEILAVGRVKKHLYLLNKDEVVLLASCNNDTNNNSCMMSCNSVDKGIFWHERLGHPSLIVLNKLGLSSKAITNDVCDVCHTSKQTRLPFGLSSINTRESDMQGGLLPPTTIPTTATAPNTEITEHSSLEQGRGVSSTSTDLENSIDGDEELNTNQTEVVAPSGQTVEVQEEENNDANVRRSGRVSRQPAWLKNYVTCAGDIAFGEAYTLFYLATSVMAQISSSSSTKEGNTSTEYGSGAFYYHKDPLYLHQSDNSGAHLVPTLLTTSNYVVWSRFMKRALRSKNKLGFVDGSFPQPSDENSEKFSE
ncbi:putative GAG-pre-integrase domain, Gag-polypeptide of LTR copia-type [Senna tora]|uniref:Putative GAG-pre-integrase domain, Gag-polypeptide of LTR copia-type n=1 Tax=Senna tora TaxID=362788 RepID=A0A834SW67_9FABA|nr:putative GAG-pre-integrase domain, Gag-polypeptide of LTR copia-type [Senna tora]